MKDAKEHILDIALELFLRSSFKGVTMKEIVKKTRLSKGAFYHYFESKEQLYEEIVNRFLQSTTLDYSKFSKDSLYKFGQDYLAEMRKRVTTVEASNTKLSLQNANYLFLIFEGMKLFPEFRKNVLKNQEGELDSWKDIIARARKTGEIESALTNEQLAKLFVYITDGVGMRLLIGGEFDTMEDEIHVLWDGLYNQIKA